MLQAVVADSVPRRMPKSKASQSRAKFCVGELVRHMLFDYRGVVIDVDMTFSGSDESRCVK